MTAPEVVPAGYEILRPLSVRDGSWVFLALNPAQQHACLKLQHCSRPASLAELVATRRRLIPIVAGDGFIPVRQWGADSSRGFLWEELEMADDWVTGRPFDPADALLYTPTTLAVQVSESGAVPTRDVIEQGLRLAGALCRLHAAGLFHRDIKPANILRYRGQWVFADYGSVGEAGASVEFPGTEGYVPPDGLGSPALDVFALGRSLYEAWTGLDRFHFPSLPPGHVRAVDWSTHGWMLNDLLLRAGNPRPSERCTSAEDLHFALENARAGRRRLSRRTLLMGGATAAAGVAAAYVWKNLPSHRAIWRRLPPKRFGMENWLGSELTCDWERRAFYSVGSDARGILFHRCDLTTWTTSSQLLKFDGIMGVAGILSKDGKSIRACASITGEVFDVRLSDLSLRRLGVANVDDNGFTGSVYFNPRNGRIGRVFGYGDFKAHNRRFELDEGEKRWIELPADSGAPWPRLWNLLFPTADRMHWFAFGGRGNPSGRQSDMSLGSSGYDGQFYELNDLWRLDLESGRWTRLLPFRRWNPVNLVSAIFHPPTQGIAFLTGSTKAAPGEATIHLWHGDPDRDPVRLPNEGDRIAMYQFWSLLREPNSNHLWVFADEGVFDVELRKA